MATTPNNLSYPTFTSWYANKNGKTSREELSKAWQDYKNNNGYLTSPTTGKKKSSPSSRKKSSPKKKISNKTSFKPGSGLNDRQKKFCSCVLKVEAKNPGSCTKDKMGKVKGCYNVYAVCAKSTRTSSKNCGRNYKFEDLPDDELRAYARLSRINYSDNESNASIINKIQAWKRNEK